MRWLAAGAFCIASLAGYAWIQSSAVPRKAIAPSPPAKQLHVGLNRRSKVDGAPPQPVRAGDLLRNGDQLEIEIQAPEPGFIYAFDESQVPGVDTPRFTLLFPGAGRQPAEARTSQRIPESQSAWLEFDGTTLQESLWLVWSRNPVGQLEPFREYSRPPSYGALPEGDARGLSLWLEQHTANPPLLEQEMNGFRWRQTSDPLIGHIALPVGTK
jgi:hypothetical protein